MYNEERDGSWFLYTLQTFYLYIWGKIPKIKIPHLNTNAVISGQSTSAELSSCELEKTVA